MPNKTITFISVVAFLCAFGMGLAEAADNETIISGGVGLTTVDPQLKQLARGITALAKPIVVIMTSVAGIMVVLNIGGDHRRPIWNIILGIGLALNFGSVLWSMWGEYAVPSTGIREATEYSLKVYDESNVGENGIDILSPFMKYYLTIIVAGSLQIKPIAIKLLLVLALIDMSVRLALDLTEKDKISWLVKTFLKIGFYIFLIQNWLGTGGLNLMDTLSKGFQEIGFIAGNYGEALPTSIDDLPEINSRDALAPDSIVNNMFKMFTQIYTAASNTVSILSPGKSIMNALFIVIPLILSTICMFLTAIEMFMARIEFYTLALLGLPLLAFGAIQHFEYLAQQTIRAVFNCGVKVSVIAFLQAVLCQLFSKYTADMGAALKGDWGTLFLLCIQLMLSSLIMFLLTLKVPKIIQGLLSGNPSMSGSDMTGTAMGAASAAASAGGMMAGASSAASMAKQAAASGKDVAPWKMSSMGQLGAALLRNAPLTGTAFRAHQDVAKYGKGNNDKNKDNPNNKTPMSSPADAPGSAPPATPHSAQGAEAPPVTPAQTPTGEGNIAKEQPQGDGAHEPAGPVGKIPKEESTAPQDPALPIMPAPYTGKKGGGDKRNDKDKEADKNAAAPVKDNANALDKEKEE